MVSGESSYRALSRASGQVCSMGNSHRSDPKAVSLTVSGWENTLGMILEVQQIMAGC